MPNDDDAAEKIIEAGKKFSQLLKEKSKKFAEAFQDKSLVAAEILKERGTDFAEAASERTKEFAKVAGEKAAEFAKATSEKTAEFSEAAAKKSSGFAKITGEKTSQFAEIASKKTAEFSAAVSKKTSEFAKAASKEIKIFTKVASKKTTEFAKTSAEATKDAALLLRPLKPREQFEVSKLADYLNKNEYGLAVGWLKQGKAKIDIRKYDWSFLVSGKNHFPKIISDRPYTKELNEKIRKVFLEERFREFAERAWNAVPQYAAPTVIGALEAKQAVSLQLFSQEPLHVLLIGDVGAGKSELFESAKSLSEHTALQASDGVCIAISDGRKVRPGAMARAGKNLCMVHRLHNLKKEDELVLYRTLETGYISYNTKSGRRRYDAPASILAECSPKYGFFEKFDAEHLKKQMPLDHYLAGKFHAVIFVKKTSLDKFADIAEKIVAEHKVIVKQDDLDFIKRYAEHAKKLEVELPAHLADKVKDFAVSLKSKENNLPYKITSQAIVGIIRMAKASARMELRGQIETKDLERVFNLFSNITNLD